MVIKVLSSCQLEKLRFEKYFTYLGGSFTFTNSRSVMRLIPLSEWCRVDEDYTVLNESLGSDELVVTGIVDDINNSSLPCAGFTSPGKVSVI